MDVRVKSYTCLVYVCLSQEIYWYWSLSEGSPCCLKALTTVCVLCLCRMSYVWRLAPARTCLTAQESSEKNSIPKQRWRFKKLTWAFLWTSNISPSICTSVVSFGVVIRPRGEHPVLAWCSILCGRASTWLCNIMILTFNENNNKKRGLVS